MFESTYIHCCIAINYSCIWQLRVNGLIKDTVHRGQWRSHAWQCNFVPQLASCWLTDLHYSRCVWSIAQDTINVSDLLQQDDLWPLTWRPRGNPNTWLLSHTLFSYPQDQLSSESLANLNCQSAWQYTNNRSDTNTHEIASELYVYEIRICSWV